MEIIDHNTPGGAIPDSPAATLARLVGERVFPGAVAMASRGSATVLAEPVGRLSVAEGSGPVAPDTVYDLASVSKIFTSVAVLTLLDRRLVDLEDQIGSYLPDLPADKRPITIRQLLTHTGGLPRGLKLQNRHTSAEPLRQALMEVPLLSPAGTAVAYSSVGYLYLGWMIEAVASAPLDRYFEEAIMRRCGLSQARFCPPEAWRPQIAPTEYVPELPGVVHGVVHDEKARILGGVTGHAGLFAPAFDVLTFAQALLDPEHPVLGGSRRLLFEDLTGGLHPRRSVAFVIDDPVFAAWDSPVFSHTGFTGTSLCLVPEHRLAVVLLSNRVNPSRDNELIGSARAVFHRSLRHWLEQTEDIEPAARDPH